MLYNFTSLNKSTSTLTRNDDHQEISPQTRDRRKKQEEKLTESINENGGNKSIGK